MSFPLVLQLQVVASCIAKMPGPALGPSEEQSLGQTFLVLSNGSAHRHTHRALHPGHVRHNGSMEISGSFCGVGSLLYLQVGLGN